MAPGPKARMLQSKSLASRCIGDSIQVLSTPIRQAVPRRRTEVMMPLVKALDGLHVLCIQGELPDVKILAHLVLLQAERHRGHAALVGPPQADLGCGNTV